MLKEILIQKINVRLLNAEHILTQTYPLLKDPRILLGVLENLYLAVNDIITCSLDEKYHNLDIEKKYDIFKIEHSGYVEVVKEIRKLWLNKKESSVDFVKNDKLYICSDDYYIRTFSENEMKKFLNNIINLKKRLGL
jgi:predicted nuclease of restriction endonuclease-like RecB superfamily